MEQIDQNGVEVQKIQSGNKRLFIFPVLVFAVLGVSLLIFLSSGKEENIKGSQTQSLKKTAITPVNRKETTEIVKNIPSVISSEISLQIISPVNSSTVNNSNISVKGKTVPFADVFINDLEIKADGLGNFSTKLTLDEGENDIVVVANDTDGNFAEQELIVNYEPE